jgi:hypothetical protein
MVACTTSKSSGNSGGALGFEATLWATADKLRGKLDAAEYKHVVLGLVFLKYISDAFEEKRAALVKEKSADSEDRDEYTAENIFWVNKIARWSYLQGLAKQHTIGKDLDDAMVAVLTPTKAPWSYIHAAMTQTATFEYLGQHADGGAYPAVRPEIIGALEVPWPDKTEIPDQFHVVCAPLYERAEHDRQESRTLATLRDALLPKLLSGELRVPLN